MRSPEVGSVTVRPTTAERMRPKPAAFMYSAAFAAYGIKCITVPNIPNNVGCILPIEVTGPQAPGLPDYFTEDVSVDVTPAEGSAVRHATQQQLLVDRAFAVRLVELHGQRLRVVAGRDVTGWPSHRVARAGVGWVLYPPLSTSDSGMSKG